MPTGRIPPTQTSNFKPVQPVVCAFCSQRSVSQRSVHSAVSGLYSQRSIHSAVSAGCTVSGLHSQRSAQSAVCTVSGLCRLHSQRSAQSAIYTVSGLTVSGLHSQRSAHRARTHYVPTTGFGCGHSSRECVRSWNHEDDTQVREVMTNVQPSLN